MGKRKITLRIKTPKRRNLLVVDARKRKAGPMADRRSDSRCRLCDDEGIVAGDPCPDCQEYHDED